MAIDILKRVEGSSSEQIIEILEACYKIQNSHQYETERKQSRTEMESVIDEYVKSIISIEEGQK